MSASELQGPNIRCVLRKLSTAETHAGHSFAGNPTTAGRGRTGKSSRSGSVKAGHPFRQPDPGPGTPMRGRPGPVQSDHHRVPVIRERREDNPEGAGPGASARPSVRSDREPVDRRRQAGPRLGSDHGRVPLSAGAARVSTQGAGAERALAGYVPRPAPRQTVSRNAARASGSAPVVDSVNWRIHTRPTKPASRNPRRTGPGRWGWCGSRSGDPRGRRSSRNSSIGAVDGSGPPHSRAARRRAATNRSSEFMTSMSRIRGA
jgi:hypothetical protein